MSVIPKANILTGNTILAADVLNIVEALDGTTARDITIAGTLTMVGLLTMQTAKCLGILSIGSANDGLTTSKIIKFYQGDAGENYGELLYNYSNGTFHFTRSGGDILTLNTSGNAVLAGSLTTNLGLQTAGANDSGGSGYRLVRIPNV